jgi:Flp pilus assembly protein TadD
MSNSLQRFAIAAIFSGSALFFSCNPANAQSRITAPSSSVASASTQQPPFDRLELLAFIAGHYSAAYVIHQVRVRGTTFTPDEEFLKAILKLGDGKELEEFLTGIKPREEGRLSPKRFAAYNIILRAVNDKTESHPGLPLAALKQALDLAQDSAALHLAYAGNLVLAQNFGQAEIEARLSLRLWPDDAEAHVSLSAALLSEGYDAPAEQEAREALRIFPAHNWALIPLGRALVREHKYSEAISRLQEARNLGAPSLLIDKQLGVALFESGDVDGAIDKLTAFLKLDPGDAEAHYELGKALRRKGRVEEAQAQLQDAARIDPKNPMFSAALDSSPQPISSAVDLNRFHQEDGSVSQNIYTNKFFGFSYEFPKGWEVVDPEIARAINERGQNMLAGGNARAQETAKAGANIAGTLLMVAETVNQKIGMYGPRMIQIQVIDTRAYAGIRTAKDFLDYKASVERVLNIDSGSSAPIEFPLDGKMLWRTDATLQVQGITQHLANVAVVLNGYTIEFLMESLSSEGLDEILKSLQTIKFTETSH